MGQKYRDKDWLQKQYVEREKTTTEIGRDLGVSESTIANWLHKHDIPTRGAHTRKGASSRQNEQLADREWLEREYCEKERSGREIAQEVGVAKQTIYNWLERHGIERREAWESILGGRGAPKHPKLRDGEWLREEYIQKDRSQPDIGRELGVTSACVKYWLDIHGISSKGNSPFVDPDTQFQRDPKWTERRQAALERDGGKCVDCGTTAEESDRDLDVHHLVKKDNFTQEDGSVDWAAANHVDNLATLCRSCHLKRHVA